MLNNRKSSCCQGIIHTNTNDRLKRRILIYRLLIFICNQGCYLKLRRGHRDKDISEGVWGGTHWITWWSIMRRFHGVVFARLMLIGQRKYGSWKQLAQRLASSFSVLTNENTCFLQTGACSGSFELVFFSCLFCVENRGKSGIY